MRARQTGRGTRWEGECNGGKEEGNVRERDRYEEGENRKMIKKNNCGRQT